MRAWLLSVVHFDDVVLGAELAQPNVYIRFVLQVVAATKKELAESGVNIAALERAARASGHASTDSSVKRSPMVLLVKNLPSEATEDALEELFAKHGTVVRVLLPRTKALAIVEMSDEQVIVLPQYSSL